MTPVALRIAFLGTAEFAVPSLRACLDAGCDIAAVVTQPDRPGDRGRPAPRPVGDLARERGLLLLQPARIREPDAIAGVLDLGVDALVVAGRTRLRPIVMTTFAAIGGLLPLALGIGSGAAMERPLAIAVIGGLSTATAFTLVVIPVLYAGIAGKRQFA